MCDPKASISTGQVAPKDSTNSEKLYAEDNDLLQDTAEIYRPRHAIKTLTRSSKCWSCCKAARSLKASVDFSGAL